MQTEVDATPTVTEHDPWCDTDQHDDPATSCASPTVDTHGLITHVTDRRAYVELATAGPLALTAAACIDLATRFTHLGRLLHV